MNLQELKDNGVIIINVKGGMGYAVNPYTTEDKRHKFNLKVNNYYNADLKDGQYKIADLKESEKWYCNHCGKYFNSQYDHITAQLNFNSTRILTIKF